MLAVAQGARAKAGLLTSAVSSAALALAVVLAAPSLGAQVRPEIVRVLPHDAQAFTQGLVVFDGKFYESTGLYGRSSVRRVAPATGVVERAAALASDRFGEGLALVDRRLIQLTWQNRIALVYDLELALITTFEYEGEGWGLCFDGTRLVMSDGSGRLSFRDPRSFAVIGGVDVRRAGVPVTRLNELECVGGQIYANVWQTDSVLRIDPASGNVLTTIDASGLLTAAETASADVLNGIAHDATTGHFFITGKLWPKVFEVRFPSADAVGGAGSGGRGGAGGTSSAGSDGASAGSSTGGSAGSSIIAGASGDAGAAAPPASSGTSGKSSSTCGCHLPGSGGKHSLLFALGVAALALGRARRQRHVRDAGGAALPS